MNLTATGNKTHKWLFIFILGAVYRLVLLWQFPALYGGDSVGRLFYRDSVFIGHWLPLLQSLIVGIFDVTNSVLIVRVAIILAASLSALGFYEFLRVMSKLRGRQSFSEKAPWRRLPFIGGILFTLCPLYVYLSMVPYQKVIFLGLMFGGLAFILGNEERKLPGYLLYGLACLTRYEAWLLLPILLFLELKKLWHGRGKSRLMLWIHTFKLLLALGWAPVLWMLLNKFHWGEFTAFLFQKQDSTVYIWQPHSSLSTAATYLAQMLWWIVKYGSPLVLFAVPGIYFFRKESRVPLPVSILGILCLCVLILSMFIAGPEFAHAHRFAAIPLSLVLIFAAVGIERFASYLQEKRMGVFKILLPIALIVLLIYSAIPVARANQRPENATAYRVASFLDATLLSDEQAVIVAEGLKEHPQVIPMSYQRIAAQSNLSRNRLLSASHLGLNGYVTRSRFIAEHNIRYVILCSKFEAWRASDRFFMELVRREKYRFQKVVKGTAEIYKLDRGDS